MINARFFLCAPRSYKGKITIYPPTMNDVITNEGFGIFLKTLTYSQEEIEDELAEKNMLDGDIPNPFQFLMDNCKNIEGYEAIVKASFYFFCKTEITFLYDINKILIGNVEKLLKDGVEVKDFVFLEEDDFFDFQNILRESVAQKPVERPDPDEDPRVKRIKAKARYRDKIKAKQGSGIGMAASLTSICCMGLGINPLNVGEMSYVAFRAIMEMYQDKEKYDLDVKTLLAGGDSKKIKPKYWIKNFD